MPTIPRNAPKIKIRLFSGAIAAPGWQLTDDRAVYYCQLCAEFHVSTGHAADCVKGSCPRLPPGAPIYIMVREGGVPTPILWAMYNKALGPLARRLLDEAFQHLDDMLATPEVTQ